MHMPPTMRRLSTIVSVALLLTLTVSQARGETIQASNGTSVTKIKVSGQFADTFLTDADTHTNGGLTASRNVIDNTSALDFSYGIVDPLHPEELILFEGAGEIPNSAFTISSTTAHLAVTVTDSPSFVLLRCIINLNASKKDLRYNTGVV
jgi:hypothetical protein